jgi:hypothetical protein
MAPFQNCVRWSRLPTKMAAKLKIEKKGGWNLKKIFFSETTEPISTKLCWNDPWVVPFQIYRRFLCEFPIGSYVKLSSAVGAILVEGPNCPTNFWKRTIQWLFYQHLVLLSEKRGEEFKKNLLLKLLGQLQPNFGGIILGWPPSKIVSGDPDF